MAPDEDWQGNDGYGEFHHNVMKVKQIIGLDQTTYAWVKAIACSIGFGRSIGMKKSEGYK